ncbi:MAG: hypothetical protein FWF52_10495 [Candidatus Azobacteroides sp.]|nr:hypothetical protein [Candidatus Azobacteroides sp.]
MESIKIEEEKVKQLLTRYWEGETSKEEEQALQRFFCEEDVPDDLKVYRSLFLWKEKQKQIKSERNFAFQSRKERRERLYPVLRIAASILIVLILGISIYTHYQQEKFIDKVFSETFTNPEDAVKETGEVLAKVSSLLQLVPKRTIPAGESDSINLLKLLKSETQDSLE